MAMRSYTHFKRSGVNYSKAFDRVSHCKLLFKCLDIKGSLLTWSRSFLTNRRQRVVIDNISSEILPETSGVPQGSMLGPILIFYQ